MKDTVVHTGSVIRRGLAALATVAIVPPFGASIQAAELITDAKAIILPSKGQIPQAPRVALEIVPKAGV